MRAWISLFVALLPCAAESNPSWWRLAPTDATAIVGIEWQSLKDTPFGAPVADELGTSIGVPELPCLTDAAEILIASPPMLALLSGKFDAATLRTQAIKLGMRPANYHGVDLWIATSGKSTLSIAELSDRLVLAGDRSTLMAAIDRSLGEHRRYSPLLERAARYQEADLFVVADKLPDPLASIFVPIDGTTRGFDGYVSLATGLSLEASIDAGSADNAAAIAESVRQSIPSLPDSAQSLQVKVDASNVSLSLELDQTQFTAGLRTAPARAVAPQPAVPQPAAATPKPAQEPAPSGPQVIRIYGLDGGPREIVLPPGKPDKPRQ
ncbi:MAG TPA: hypothetical protein VMG40_20870 [Bryobacteraceae bacterium]|nr:hypothetical protein [Bryobacteraceae bacterium]